MKNILKLILTKKAVLFDLDGTLIDSMWMWKAIDVDYLKRYGYEYPENLQREIEGMSFSETAVYFKERFKIPESLAEIEKEWNRMSYDTYKNKVSLKPGVIGFLDFLKSNGIKLAIATSNSRTLTETVLLSLGVMDYFDSIVTSNEVHKGKPAPDIYIRAAESVDCTEYECIVFEDIPNGIIAGRAAGMSVVAVEDDYSKDVEQDKRELADYYIKDYDELMKG